MAMIRTDYDARYALFRIVDGAAVDIEDGGAYLHIDFSGAFNALDRVKADDGGEHHEQ